MKRRRRESMEYQDAQLNIMPFIDIFSVLNTFLLMSAAFVTLGVIKVQVPFLSNAEKDESKPTRSIQVKVDATKDEVSFITSFSLPPEDLKTEKFPLTRDGLKALHTVAVRVRQENPTVDLISAYFEDDVAYNNVIEIIDAVKTRLPEDPEFPSQSADPVEVVEARNFVFSKVVVASVLL